MQKPLSLQKQITHIHMESMLLVLSIDAKPYVGRKRMFTKILNQNGQLKIGGVAK